MDRISKLSIVLYGSILALLLFDLILEVDRVIRKSFVIWGNIDPTTINPAQVRELLHTIKGGVRNQKYHRAILSKYLGYCGNYVLKGMRFRDPPDMRPKAKWLTEEQIAILLTTDWDPRKRMIIHLGLCIGLRRVEIMRLKLQDIHYPYLDVMGK